MPYKVYKKGTGYKACKKGGDKCFSKKPLSKKKAEAQKRALYASEAGVNESLENLPEGPTSVEGDTAVFNLGECTVKVVVPESALEDVKFEVHFENPQSACDLFEKLSTDDIEAMGDLAIEAVRGDSPFGEGLQFEKLIKSYLSEP